MSRFFSEKFKNLEAYVPGEQPRNGRYIKLNTNESPFPTPQVVAEAARAEAALCQLYSDPECTALRAAAARNWGVQPEELLMTNGSDEILNFAFAAFCDEHTPAVYPAVSYGFYPVFAAMNRVPAREIPLRADLSIDPAAYDHAGGTVVIANPNAPTGVALPLAAVEEIVRHNPDHVVVVDEAYVDFGGESAVSLIRKYSNLLVTQTFSKSRSLAGARLGLGIADPALIADLNTVKYSTNPYNVNRVTAAMGVTALGQEHLFMAQCRRIGEIRDDTAGRLRSLGFTVPESRANFLFARWDRMGGEALYRTLKERGILIRHFDRTDLADWNRITVGTQWQMNRLLEELEAMIAEGTR